MTAATVPCSPEYESGSWLNLDTPSTGCKLGQPVLPHSSRLVARSDVMVSLVHPESRGCTVTQGLPWDETREGEV